MAILQLLIGFALQSVNRIVTIALGWATVLLFGRVPRERQIYLSLIVFSSIIWLVIVIGIAWPPIGTFLLTFIRIPRWVNANWIRIALAGAATILPLFVGTTTLLLRDPGLRPTDVASKWRTALSGYRFTAGIALTLLVTMVIAPVMLVRNLLRRWTTNHFPVVIQTDDYAEVVADIERGFETTSLRVHQEPTHVLMRIPTMMLTAFVGGSFDRLVARELSTLGATDLEIVVHPFDLIVSGPRAAIVRAQAVLAVRLPFTRAYLTWTEEGRQMEDRIKAAWHDAVTALDEHPPRDTNVTFSQIEQDLNTSNVDFEEWEILFRVLLLMQRQVSRVATSAP
jgi:hypothetical protein